MSRSKEKCRECKHFGECSTFCTGCYCAFCYCGDNLDFPNFELDYRKTTWLYRLMQGLEILNRYETEGNDSKARVGECNLLYYGLDDVEVISKEDFQELEKLGFMYEADGFFEFELF